MSSFSPRPERHAPQFSVATFADGRVMRMIIQPGIDESSDVIQMLDVTPTPRINPIEPDSDLPYDNLTLAV